MATTTAIDLRALFLQAHARGYLYPRMSNTELRRALRKANGDDEAFEEQFPQSVPNFREHIFKPLVSQLTPYGYGFSFEQKSYVFIGGLESEPTAEQPPAESEAITELPQEQWTLPQTYDVPRTQHQEERAAYATTSMRVHIDFFDNGYVAIKRTDPYNESDHDSWVTMLMQFRSGVGCALPKHRWTKGRWVYLPGSRRHQYFDKQAIIDVLIVASMQARVDLTITGLDVGDDFDARAEVLV